jgi:hypothetical protein
MKALAAIGGGVTIWAGARNAAQASNAATIAAPPREDQDPFIASFTA